MIKFLLKSRSLWSLLILTLLILCTFLTYLIPSNFTWMGYQSVTGDTAQHLSGWYAFVQEPWRLPLLKINSINYPTGTTISLLDSIPLFAIPFKLFRHWLPVNFNFFGIFFLFASMLQASAALTLSFATKRNNILATSAFVILAIIAPIAIYRIGDEDSLACQAFILFGISGYFFSYFQKWSLKGCHVFFGILVGTSLLVHPYLTAMTYPFYLASLAKIKAQEQLTWRKLFPTILTMHCIILIEALIFGLGQGSQDNGTFGLSTMNLLAPLYGGWLTKYQALLAYSAQWEGFAYLGLGFMAMLVLSLFLEYGNFKLYYKKHRGLVLIALLCFIYSIYGKTYIGHIQIFHFGGFHSFITNSFRTNGRFFWPTWYILMTFAIISLTSKKTKRITLLVPILLCVQIFDVSGYIKIATSELFQNFSSSTIDNPKNTKIVHLIRQNRMVIFYPKMACSNMSSVDYSLLIQTQILTAKAGIPLNTGYIAHYTTPEKDCTDDANHFSSLTPKLLISEINNPSPTIKLLLEKDPKVCQTIAHTYYCEYNEPK